MTLRHALVAVDARDLRPACLLSCIGGTCCVGALGRGWVQPSVHTLGRQLKPHAQAQPDLIGWRVVDVLIPNPVDEPGMQVVGHRPAVALHGR